MPEIIASRTFTTSDLLSFAKLSGDWNPIHVDPILARRLLTGGVVVHGMNGLLWALECHFSLGGTAPRSIRAKFHGLMRPDERLEVQRSIDGEGTVRLAILRKGEDAAIVTMKGGGEKIDGRFGDALPARGEPSDKTFNEMRGDAGTVDIATLHADLSSTYPSVCDVLGLMPTAGILTLSRIVGMECPGLNSLFTGIDMVFDQSAAGGRMKWAVAQHTVSRAPIRIDVEGGGTKGSLDAFFRPQAVSQPSMEKVAEVIQRGAFVGQRALIIGGSRGLGELIAKIVAAGGGDVVITYRIGVKDAQRVIDEIRGWGGTCRAFQADAEQPEQPAQWLLKEKWEPTHLYYFATPRIASQGHAFFDDALYDALSRIYLGAFQRLAVRLARICPKQIRVFYPSSIFLSKLPREFAEYIAAKAGGESVCRILNRHVPNLSILVSRLPRLKTDQTASLLPTSTKTALRSMKRVVEAMHSFNKREIRTK